jgi:hypothetical protein
MLNCLKQTIPGFLLIIYSWMWIGCSQETPDTLHIDLMNTQLKFQGTIYPKRYNTYSDRANGHHFIVYSGGSNAHKALITTDVPDEQILSGLEALGAVAGNNLTQAAWDERNIPNSDAANQRVAGTPINIYVQWQEDFIPAYELLNDTTASEFNIRFGGHVDLIPVWQSGCVTCLFSCPGGRTSNEAFTIRDQAQNKHSFFADESRLPEDGTKVYIILKPDFSEHQPFEENNG